MSVKQVAFDDTAKKLKELSETSPTSITQLLLSLISTENSDELSLSTHYRLVAGKANQLQTRVIDAINSTDVDDAEVTVSHLLMHAAILGRVTTNLNQLAQRVSDDMESIDERRKQRGTVEEQRCRLEQTFKSRMAKHPSVTTVAGKERPRLFSRTEVNF